MRVFEGKRISKRELLRDLVSSSWSAPVAVESHAWPMIAALCASSFCSTLSGDEDAADTWPPSHVPWRIYFSFLFFHPEYARL